MSAFFEENQHFISIKLFKEMRGLGEVDRITRYERDLKNEVRRRFKAHYSKTADFKHKLSFYSDAIDYFKDFEFRYLLNSLYFESEAEGLLKELGPKIIRSLPVRFQDNLHLVELIEKRENPDFIDNYISGLFRDKLGLSIGSSMSKSDANNPEANKLSEWLLKSLRSEISNNEVVLILFHFIKYWHQTYFIHFFIYKNYIKSTVLLTKLINSYKGLPSPQIKLNLSKCLDVVRSNISDLLPGPLITPYIDSVENALGRDKSVTTGYLVKLKEFQQMLIQNSMLFNDLTNLGWVELFQKHCTADLELKHLYFDAVKQKVRNGVLPRSEEITFFSDRNNFNGIKSKSKNADLFLFIVRANYLFTFWQR